MTIHPSQRGHGRQKEYHTGQPLLPPTKLKFYKGRFGETSVALEGGAQGHRPQGWEPGPRSPQRQACESLTPSPMAATDQPWERRPSRSGGVWGEGEEEAG